MKIEENDTSRGDIIALVLDFLNKATQNIDQWLDLLHEDFVMEFPYADSAGLPGLVSGKEMIRKSTASFLATVPGIRFDSPVVIPCLDPHQAFATYEVNVIVPATDKVYSQTYITKFREKDGKIIHMMEYYDPVKFNAAFKQ